MTKEIRNRHSLGAHREKLIFLYNSLQPGEVTDTSQVQRDEIDSKIKSFDYEYNNILPLKKNLLLSLNISYINSL